MSELAAPDALIQPHEQSLYRLRELAADSNARTMHRWALKFLAPKQREPVRVLGLLLLEAAKDASDAGVVEGYLQDASAFVRRAAFHALSRISAEDFQQHAAAAAQDSSPLVRETVARLARS